MLFNVFPAHLTPLERSLSTNLFFFVRTKKMTGLLTWTGDSWVVGELLSREQEHDLQRGDGQERDLVWEIQEVKT